MKSNLVYLYKYCTGVQFEVVIVLEYFGFHLLSPRAALKKYFHF